MRTKERKKKKMVKVRRKGKLHFITLSLKWFIHLNVFIYSSPPYVCIIQQHKHNITFQAYYYENLRIKSFSFFTSLLPRAHSLCEILYDFFIKLKKRTPREKEKEKNLLKRGKNLFISYFHLSYFSPLTYSLTSCSLITMNEGNNKSWLGYFMK